MHGGIASLQGANLLCSGQRGKEVFLTAFAADAGEEGMEGNMIAGFGALSQKLTDFAPVLLRLLVDQLQRHRYIFAIQRILFVGTGATG